jgi:cyclomaltodextrinase
MSAIFTPEWVKHAIFYQIFPDRFARSAQNHLPPGMAFKPWGSPPEEQGFQGGDLYGIVEKLDYLTDLGINAIYLNPIFSSAANHRYHTFDYMQVDPLLGGDQAFRNLLDKAHDRKIRVVIDGVFNHASRGFWAFHHILENHTNSPYLNWFHVYDQPLRPYSSDANNPANYGAWWGNPALPKFNTDSPAVQEYIFKVARHWIEFGADGWRLDVPGEIDDDNFWRQFRQIVKGTNPDAYIVGEIWHDGRRWLQGDQFDAVMNYYFGQACLGFFARRSIRPDLNHQEFAHVQPMNGFEFVGRIQEVLGWYDWQINLVQLNMGDSHDTPRLLWMMGEDVGALKLFALFQMTMPGAPCIYYGTEIGMSARGDPFCREAYPWDVSERIDQDLHAYYRRVIDLRNTHPVLRAGELKFILTDDERVVFRRNLGHAEAVVAINNAETAAEIHLPDGDLGASAYYRVWPENTGAISSIEGSQLSIRIPKRSGVVMVNQS